MKSLKKIETLPITIYRGLITKKKKEKKDLLLIVFFFLTNFVYN
jgi:hypothetical protein